MMDSTPAPQQLSIESATVRWNAPLAIALGGLACALAFIAIGPQAARSLADDAGVLSFIASEAGRRAPASSLSYSAARFESPRYHNAGADRPGRHRASIYLAHRKPDDGAGKHTRLRAIVAFAEKARKASGKMPRGPTVPQAGTPEFARADAAPQTRVAAAPVSPLLDKTMRRGDALMTEKGIRIFRGASRFPYLVADFQPLSRMAGVAHRGELQAIDRISQRQNWMASYQAPAPTIVARRVDVPPAPGPRMIGGLSVY